MMKDYRHSYSPVATNNPEKGRSEDPKGTHGVPQTARSKTLSKSANREATNHWKNNSQLNTPDSLPLKLPQIQAPLLSVHLALSPASWHT
jgi:hypothetical protein